MGYTIYYAVKDLSRADIEKGVDYVQKNFDQSLFQKDFDNGFAILLNQLVSSESDVRVESFVFPPLTSHDRPYGYIKTNQIEPHTQHIKDLMGGLERLFPGRFAATDNDSFNLGTLALRRELEIED